MCCLVNILCFWHQNSNFIDEQSEAIRQECLIGDGGEKRIHYCAYVRGGN
jgi:hypothetical protein